MRLHLSFALTAFVCSGGSFSAIAQQQQLSLFQQCVLDRFELEEGQTTIEAIKFLCEQQAVEEALLAERQKFAQENDGEDVVKKDQPRARAGGITSRLIRERQTAFDPYSLTPHKMNYILPVTVTDKINSEQYQEIPGWAENLSDFEAKFQLSLKVPLTQTSTFIPGDAFFFGFTLEAWWQVYAEDISQPFRETNYQPEIFYLAPLDWQPFGGNTGFGVGIEHQSNGRDQLLSRSWNRVYLNLLYEKEDFALSLRPWYRLPEDDKESPLDPDGDDNPDIDEYMGHFELLAAYQWREYEFSVKGRQNFAESQGAVELGMTFPLWGRLQGYAQFFSGYGESLIDYNHKQTRLGIGIALTDFL